MEEKLTSNMNDSFFITWLFYCHYLQVDTAKSAQVILIKVLKYVSHSQMIFSFASGLKMEELKAQMSLLEDLAKE